MNQTVTPAQLKERLSSGGELALLDVREEGVFSRGHLFFATMLPLSWIELRIRTLVPRLGTPIILCDDGDGLAERAAEKLDTLGYGDVALLEGGNPAWKAAGRTLYSGVNVPSKAFGEFVEHTYGTPSISAEELRGMLEGDRDLIILDSRPMEEFTRMNIPGGVDMPGAELVYRIKDMAPSRETLVVVNCAGRTRSIIGAQSLINSGLPNQVVALRNGTMGWHLAGFDLERGKHRGPPEPSSPSVVWAQDACERVASRFGVNTVDLTTLEQWQKEQDERSLYLLDVRTPSEFEAGHMPGARNAPGGQLVQSTDAYMATRGARVVLLDNEGVRAIMTASWLVQMGWRDVSVLEGGMLPFGLETGPAADNIAGQDALRVTNITPAELALQLDGAGSSRPTVIDLATSDRYQAGHIPGAVFAIRSRFAQDLADLAKGSLVVTSSDGVLAALAAQELERLGKGPVSVLWGGTKAWEEDGHPLTKGAENMASAAEDVFPKPYDRPGGVEEAMRQYLEWEVNLVAQIEKDGEANFKVFA